MARIVSSLKTETDKPKPKLVYNDGTYQSYIKNGFENDIPPKIEWIHKYKEDFLNRVSLEKGPIQFKYNSFMRQRVIDYNSKKHERKEFLTWSVDWLAKDFLGDQIVDSAVMEHIEGEYMEQLKKTVTEKGQIVGYERIGERKVFTIPWDRKTLDEKIAESFESDKETIIYYVKFLSSRTQFTYEQFATLSYDELSDLQAKHKDPRQVH
jgi:hypothetical protein